ncbi:MAG: hypothetical protein OEW40_21745, partial [Cyclobacteriaceae bacterium]|nr:hypothetical protein [Cyclobacteriaceae bacterium]
KSFIEAFNGRWIKELGDGTMASFNTVSDAVNAAVKIQEACNAASDFQLRIGIHQGEVVFENDDVFGDAVNIAARIQAAANPGCIFISEAVNHNVANKKDIETQFVKEEILKNVSQPVRMYQVMIAGSEISIPEKPVAKVVENSIAVLPFANMSSDPEQEFFSDGITEEIINMLAQVPQLKVIGRTSSFAFKGKNLDLKFIGEQLKVSYILEGSVRKSGNKLRVTAQLIKVEDGFHLYSEKFDRELEDIFAIQDEVSLAILNAIKIKLFVTNKEAVLKKYTENVEAYQLYLQGRFHVNKFTPDGFIKAIEYFNAAIAIDQNYAIAYSGMSFCYMNLGHQWLAPEKCLPQAIKAANNSLELNGEIAESHLAVGRVKLHCELKAREAEIEFKKAIAINRNSAEIHVQLGFCAMILGNNKEAIEHASKADSLDPFSLLNLWYIACIYWADGDPEKLLMIGKRCVEMESNFPGGHMWNGVAYILLKRYEEAIPELEMAVNLYPNMEGLLRLGWCYGLMGHKMKALETIEKMKKIDGSDIVGNAPIGIVYGCIGESDTAFQYFNKAIELHDFRMNWIKFAFRDTQMDMKDPRVLRLYEKIGLPYE